MPDKTNTTPVASSPRILRDVNFNQTLDGKDLLIALEGEDRNNQNTNAADIKSLPIHGWLMKSNAALEAVLGVVTGYQVNGQMHAPINLKVNAAALSKALQDELTELREGMKKDPKFRDKKIKQIEEIIPSNNPLRQLHVNNMKQLLDLAERFDVDFPKGVKIEPNELVNVLWHVEKIVPGAKDSAGRDLQSEPLPNPLPTNPQTPQKSIPGVRI